MPHFHEIQAARTKCQSLNPGLLCNLLPNGQLAGFTRLVPTNRVCAGDVDQLPPVGAGKVLTDAIQSGVIPGVDLREIFRQAQQSGIVRTAHAVNGGNFQAVHQGLPTIDPTHVKASFCVSPCMVAVSAALDCVQTAFLAPQSSQHHACCRALHGTSARSSHDCMSVPCYCLALCADCSVCDSSTGKHPATSACIQQTKKTTAKLAS